MSQNTPIDEAELRRTLQAEKERLTAELRAATIASGARRAALNAGVHPDHLDDAAAIASRRLDVVDGTRLMVLDEDGDPSATSVEHYFAHELRTGREWLFEPADASGGRAAVDGVASLKDLRTTAEKSAFIKRRGLAAFQALPRE